jgi:hypothetical protein
MSYSLPNFGVNTFTLVYMVVHGIISFSSWSLYVGIPYGSRVEFLLVPIPMFLFQDSSILVSFFLCVLFVVGFYVVRIGFVE